MKAEVLSIGEELTNGQNLDTNAQWISRRLSDVGIPVRFHTTVGDDLADNLDAFGLATRRARLVIATGGLGPTADDLTREVLAQLAGVPLELHEPSLAAILALFERRNRVMPERNRVQAMFPKGATPIPNPNGTAPGIWMMFGDTLVAALPGVPKEMFPMFDDWLMPRLRERFAGAGRVIRHRSLHCFGAGESAVETMLGDLIRRGRDPLVGITASEATITLRVTTAAANEAEADAKIAPDLAYIREKLGSLIYAADGEPMQSVVARLLKEKGATVATAESCTGGLVGHLLTEIPGISAHYRGGVVAYSNEAKMELLGVPASMLAAHGAVSPEVASAMATGVRQRFGSDCGIGVTGVAGPDGGTPAKPVGLVYVALAHAGGVRVGDYNWAADRSSVKLRSAKTALNLLRKHLLGAD